MAKLAPEKETIIIKYLLDGMPMKDIEKKVGCSYKTIQRIKVNVKKDDASVFESRKKIMIDEFLGQAHFDNELVQQFESDEIESYIDYYFTYKDQFEDILGTEKTQLDVTIRLYLLFNRVLRRLKATEFQYMTLTDDMAELTRKIANEKDPVAQKFYVDKKFLLGPQITTVSTIIDKLNKQSQEFDKNQRDALDKLDATRTSRLRKGLGAEQKWVDLIKGLEERKNREIHSQMAERLRIAQEREGEKMRRLHEFADSTQDFFLLDDQTDINEDKIDE